MANSSNPSSRSFLYTLLILVFGLAPGQGQAHCQCNSSEQIPNGISVGRPKVFDERSLTLMLEGLNETLHGLQVIDQRTLAAALGMQQGFSSREFSSNLTVTGLPISSNETETVTNSGIVNSVGTPLPDTTQTTAKVNQPGFTPTPPTVDAAIGTPPTGFNPIYGENASDLLSDQVSLTYQIFNLRLLLDRSLSDRLLGDDDPRLQAVLGFNVSLDPPRSAADAVAVVEIVLTSDGKAPEGISLVSLMPQEKTYNTAALSTKVNAFGGAAVVRMFQVGYGQRNRSQNFYLYRDSDTISFERMPQVGDGKSVKFGWMFRPVLGRRSVSPGLRQLFAIVSLPGNMTEARNLKAEVRTYWKRYDRDTMTSFLPADATRPAKAGYVLSLGLGRPQIFSPRYDNRGVFTDIEVKATPQYEKDLRAEVDDVSWRPIGTTMALVTVKGHNFFSGTKVAVGDKIYGNGQDSLALKSSETLEFTTAIDALAQGPASVIGRYGGAVPITAQLPADARTSGVWIQGTTISSLPFSGGRTLQLFLAGANGVMLSKADLPQGFDPIVIVNGGIVRPPYLFSEEWHDGMQRLVLRVTVPDSLLEKGGGVVRLAWPFLPPDAWSPTSSFGNSCQVIQALRLGANSVFLTRDDPTGFTADPQDLSKPSESFCWRAVVGDKAIPIYSTSCPEGDKGPTPPNDNAFSLTIKDGFPDQFVLLDPEGFACALTLVELKPKSPEPRKPTEVRQFDSVWVSIEVSDSSKIVKVEADGHDLRSRVPNDEKGKPVASRLEVEVTRALTAKPGSVDITMLGADNKQIKNLRLNVLPASTAKNQ